MADYCAPGIEATVTGLLGSCSDIFNIANRSDRAHRQSAVRLLSFLNWSRARSEAASEQIRTASYLRSRVAPRLARTYWATGTASHQAPRPRARVRLKWWWKPADAESHACHYDLAASDGSQLRQLWWHPFDGL